MWHSILPPVLAIRPAVFPFFMSPMSIQNTSTPPFKFTPASLGRVSEDQSFPISPEASIKHITSKFAQLRLLQNYADRSPLGFVCINNPVAARLQEGPTCGLVSLRMAAESILERAKISSQEPQTQTLLALAKSLGMSGYGEMFSARHMADLVEKYYGPSLTGETWTSEWDSSLVQRLLQVIIGGSIALVPYDVDKNHEPCMVEGKKAHWTTIKGFVLPVYSSAQLSYAASLPQFSVQDISGLPFFHLELSSIDQGSSIDLQQLVNLSSPELVQDLIVVAQQSKSKHQALWKFSSLRDSNANLKHFDESRVTASDFVVPNELSELRGKAVFVLATAS